MRKFAILLLLCAAASAAEGVFAKFLSDVRSASVVKRRAALENLLADPTLVPEDGWDRARRILLDVLDEDGEGELRGLAARALALRRDGEADARILTRLTREEGWRAQRLMLEALTGFTDPIPLALAKKQVFREPRVAVQALWAEALGRSDHEEARAVLWRVARVPLDWPVAQAVAAALSRHPAPETVDRLIDLLWSEDEGVRRVAHESLVIVTGNRDLPIEAGPWVEWWGGAREGFVFPGRAGPVAPPDGAVPTMATDDVTVPTYYDIPIRGRRVIFCLDVSASMWGPKIRAAVRELSGAVRGLTPRYRFNVIFFNEHPYPWRNELLPAHPFQKLECVRSFTDMETKKYTNLFDTLERALGFAGIGRYAVEDPPGVDDVFLLTDGEPNRGRYRDTKGILAGLDALDPDRRVRIHTISVGDVSRELMTAIAAQHGGVHHHVEFTR